MARTKLIAATLLVALGVHAAPAAAAADDKVRNPTIYSVNQPVVQRTDFVIDLNAGAGVPDSELYRLAHWFDSLRLGYGDRIAIDTGGYDNPRARQDIAGVASEYGLLVSRDTPVTVGQVQPGIVRVIVTRSVASVPGCPNWEDADELGNRITTASNFGCATNSNLARMVADPNDLVLGQSDAHGGGYAEAATKAIKAYRDRVPTGTNSSIKTESTGAGK